MRVMPSLNCRLVVVLAAFLTLLASCKRNETKTLLEPSQALGAVLAEEAARAAGVNTRIAIISHDARWGPPSAVEKAFEAALARHGFSSFIAKSVDLGDPMSRREAGVQPDDYFEASQKATDVGAIVSFVGIPLVTVADAARLQPGHPPLLIVATVILGDQRGLPANRARLASLLEAKIIQVAIIDGGSDSTAAPSDKVDAVHELFARSYSILRQPQ
jgi:hypothetical protein